MISRRQFVAGLGVVSGAVAVWQTSFWGPNYPRLLDIKRKYDPANLFRLHHGVGSE